MKDLGMKLGVEVEVATVKKAAIYMRSARNGSDGDKSIRTQKQLCLHSIKEKDVEVHKIYSDNGFSGVRTDNRPAFNEMVEDMKNGKFDVLVVSKLDRITRNSLELMRFVEKANRYGVTVEDAAEVMEELKKYLELMKNLEDDSMSERIKIGLRHRR